MPTASYLRNNDYSIQDFKPFDLPYSATLQELATKNAYWQQGVQKIKESFDAVLGLDPQFAQHKEYLDNFTEQANKELTKAGKSDLAQDDNVGAALAIFKPLYDTSNSFNKGLLTDSQTNEFYKRQNQLADAARSSNGGKTWNKNNQFYMQSAYQKYMNDAKTGDISKVDENWSQKKGYIPYYDYSNDVIEAKKNCHESGDDTVTRSSNTLYLEKTSSLGITANAMQNCLQFLPDAAKQQIGIDSYANYYTNKAGLLNDYKDLVYNRYNDEKNGIQVQLAAAKATNNKPLINFLTNRFNQADTLAKSGEAQWNSMTHNTDGSKFLNENYESIASTVGVAHFIRNAGQAFSWQNNKHELTPDAAGMLMAKQVFDAHSQAQSEKHDFLLNDQKHSQAMELERLKLSADETSGVSTKLADGTNMSDIQRQQDIIDKGTPINNEAAMLKNIDDSKLAMSNSITTIKNMIIEKLKSDPNNPAAKSLLDSLSGTNIPTATMLNFFKVYNDGINNGGKRDTNIDMAIKTFKNATNEFQDVNTQYNNINSKLKTVDTSKFDNVTPIFSGITNDKGEKIFLTKKDMADIALGHSIKGVSSDRNMGAFAAESLVYTDSKGNKKLWKDIPGNTVSTDGPSTWGSGDGINPSNGDAEGMVKRGLNTMFGNFPVTMRNIYHELSSKLDERKSAFKDNTMIANGYFSTGDTPKTYTGLNDKIKTQLGIPKDDNNIHVVSQFRDNEGNGYVRVYGKGKKGEENVDLTSNKRIDNYNIVKLGGKNDGQDFIKIPSLYTALPSFMTGKNVAKVTNFTNDAMNNLPSGSTSDKQFNTESATGKDVRVTVTNINGLPIYNIMVFDPAATNPKNQWILKNNGVPINTDLQLLTAINSF